MIPSPKLSVHEILADHFKSKGLIENSGELWSLSRGVDEESKNIFSFLIPSQDNQRKFFF